MIDIEELLVDEITKALEDYSNIIILSSELTALPKLPCVCINEIDNTQSLRGLDTSDIEQYAQVTYQIDIYSNLGDYKKKQAKEIHKIIDELMYRLGFYRRSKNAVEFTENRVCRINSRYSGTVSNDNKILRR